MTRLYPTSTASASASAAAEALSAPVADPLWLLARQWQNGEFTATDGGSAVRTTLRWTCGPLAYAGAALTGPLEERVEPEPMPAEDLDTGRRVRLISELLRRLRDAGVSRAGVTTLRTAWITAYPLATGQSSARLAAVATRLPDPVPLLTATRPAPGLDALTADDRGKAASVLTAWKASTVATVTTGATSRAPSAWDGTRLVYNVTCQARVPTGTLTLSAADYDGTGLDWYSFDRAAINAGAGDASPPQTVAVTPARVTFPGMPRPRWWEFEDGEVNLDALRSSSDPARAVLATFAHSYSNDWFLVPLTLQPGWARVEEITVIDTFGTETHVPSVASLDQDAGPWRLWDLASSDQPTNRPGGQPMDPATGLRLCWPVGPPPLEGPPLEEVLLARDEMANLAWIIELRTSDPDGMVVDRYQRWLTLRPNPADPAAGSDYRLGTALPDFWYPLMATGPLGAQALQLADVPDQAVGVSDAGVQGALVTHDPATRLALAVISRQGRRMTRRDRLTLSHGGPRTWRARVTGPGQGESSSGLRFDLLT